MRITKLLLCFVLIANVGYSFAQRKAGKDTILFTLTTQNQVLTTDSNRSTFSSYTCDINSIFFGTIHMDSVPMNKNTIKIFVNLTIDSTCGVRLNSVTGNDKDDYLIRKTREYFNTAKIVFITPEGLETTNCGALKGPLILPVKYKFL